MCLLVGIWKKRFDGENPHGSRDCHYSPEPSGGDSMLWWKNKEVCVVFAPSFTFSALAYSIMFGNL